MPKMSDRDRLVELENRHRKVTTELDQARRAVRDRYAAIVAEMSVEQLPEREFREIIGQVIRVSGSAALVALKALPTGQA